MHAGVLHLDLVLFLIYGAEHRPLAAFDFGLLPVRIDLDELTVRTAGHFWKEVYTALLEAAADAGCWGGRARPW